MKKVYLVISFFEEVIAVFADEDDAKRFQELVEPEQYPLGTHVEARTVHYGQPPHRGYNE